MLLENKQDIAILFFSRKANAESRSKKWFKNNHSVNLHIAKSLIERSYKTLKNTGLPVFHFHEDLQKGNNFGSKIAHAFQSIFDQGFKGVICVGNDTPNLNSIDWKQVIESIKSKAVLGASARGGAYCIGLRKDQFDFQTFSNLPWQTKHLFEALCAFVQEAIVLPNLNDVNTLNDIIRLKLNQQSTFLYELIKRWLSTWLVSVNFKFVYPPRLVISTFHLKRPPPFLI